MLKTVDDLALLDLKTKFIVKHRKGVLFFTLPLVIWRVPSKNSAPIPQYLHFLCHFMFVYQLWYALQNV